MNKRKKIVLLTLAFLALSLQLGLPKNIQAHELIPQALQEFIKKNPHATSEEIERFVITEAPEFASKFPNIDDLVKIIRNQETSWFDNAKDFVKLGVEHILDGPDHILFVLSLLLVVASFREMFRITSAFTIAHSITLVLAGFGLLVISSRIVEPLIAFSISFVAVTTILLKGTRYELKSAKKLGVVFFFGLFHGLGFAGLLEELGIPSNKFLSSLFSFNVGIELGQLLIVAVGLPLAFLLRKTKWETLILKIIALIITLIGIFWGVQRIVG